MWICGKPEVFPKLLQLGRTQLLNRPTGNLIMSLFWVLLGKVQIRSYPRAVVLNWGSSVPREHQTVCGAMFGCYKLVVGH